MLSTSVALTLGFSVLTLSQFGSTMNFGFLSAVAMSVALLSDLLVTPSLLLSTPIITSWDFLKLRVADASLRASGLLRGMSVTEVKKLALLGVLKKFEPGMVVVRQGDESREMYLILSGSVRAEASDAIETSPVVLGQFGRGEVFGEMAFITGEPRSATVAATESVEALMINEKTLARVRERFPRVALKLYANLAALLTQRLRGTTQTLLTERGVRPIEN
jgi:hypothetical protein